VANIGDRIEECRVLMTRPDRKRPVGTFGCRWEDNIKMDIQEVGVRNTDWVDLAGDTDRFRAFLNESMKFRFP
jgi:hypothetical protein